ncbi:Probable oxidoreductase OrdL [Eumeta japonica]|uniref:Probable oxidoreductase OrdL n=1 Tax=Eumeta variegata TaxID=151549 RepID=A0A4C1SKL6_EUMVA|nr:Probable oxidoreductase OrdL [Eumeta japonica]
MPRGSTRTCSGAASSRWRTRRRRNAVCARSPPPSSAGGPPIWRCSRPTPPGRRSMSPPRSAAPHAARIQPAKLAAGLARVVEELGVDIYERTRAVEIAPHRVRTTHGTVSADFVVRATEGFTANLQGLKRLWLPMNSSLIATEPLSTEVWDELHWNQGEVLGDMAHVYMYAQRTADDRIAIGGRGVPYRYGSRTDTDGRTPDITVETLRRILHRFFPATRGAAIDHVWSGVLGVPRDWSATVGLDRETGIAWGGGYVGTGVTSTNLAGRTIADLILGTESDLVSLPWVNHRVRKWEPEPLRWLATRGLYAAYGVADRAEARGRATTSHRHRRRRDHRTPLSRARTRYVAESATIVGGTAASYARILRPEDAPPAHHHPFTEGAR